MRDHYRVLGLDRNASEKEIKEAYRRLSLQYHPDRNPNDPNAAAFFRMITEAYAVLADAEKRRRYDGREGSTRESSVPAGRSPEPPSAVPAAERPAPPRPYDPEWAEIWARQPSAMALSPFIGRLLWADLAVSVVFFFFCFIIRSALPALPEGLPANTYGGGGTWMSRLIAAGVVGLALSGIAVLKLRSGRAPRILGKFVVAKVFLWVWLVSGVLGLASEKMSITIPVAALVWNALMIVIVFVYQLDREVGGSR